MSIRKLLNKAALTSCGIALLTGPVLAGPLCANPTDMAAFRTAAVQQQLMVAALTCHDVEAYNRFVLAYQPELQKSDADLKAYFIRGGSEAAYDTFKTKLANLSSLSDIANGPAYCSNAAAAFDMALKSRQALSSFVADQRLMIAMPEQTSCSGSKPAIVQAAAVKPQPVKVAEVKPASVSAPVRVAEMKAPPVQERVAAATAMSAPQEAVSVPAHALPASPYGNEQPPPAPATYTYQDQEDAPPPVPPRPARPQMSDGYYAARYAYYQSQMAQQGGRWVPPSDAGEYYNGR